MTRDNEPKATVSVSNLQDSLSCVNRFRSKYMYGNEAPLSLSSISRKVKDVKVLNVYCLKENTLYLKLGPKQTGDFVHYMIYP